MRTLNCFVATLLLLPVVPAAAQDTRGMIFGTVTDQQGASVPGAAVTVLNIETNVRLKLQTNEKGYRRSTTRCRFWVFFRGGGAGPRQNLLKGKDRSADMGH